jgi:hypothetical protein
MDSQQQKQNKSARYVKSCRKQQKRKQNKYILKDDPNAFTLGEEYDSYSRKLGNSSKNLGWEGLRRGSRGLIKRVYEKKRYLHELQHFND